MRLSFADANLHSVDGLAEFDSACLFVFEDERPLRAFAGYIDWRLCGAVSRVLKDGRFTGAKGDALLLPTWGRIPPSRVFCFGAGRRDKLDREELSALLKRGFDAMSLAGAKAFATDIPSAGLSLEDAEKARLVVQAAASFKGQRIAVLGEGRALAKAFGEVARDMKGLEVDKEPLFQAAPLTVTQVKQGSGKSKAG